ncbi:MAG: ClbS/DfsB family four-helix bundle protein [Chloroflexota bacterium]|nr:ClbS/DfsB family four-helix bundle protein [Chloroflexota bacterium]
MSKERLTTPQLLARIEANWEEMNTYLKSLEPTVLFTLTDAGGWTIKDHLIHLAVWEDAMLAVLNGIPARDHLQIDAEVWKSGFDAINAVIQQRHRDTTLNTVIRTAMENHARLIERIKLLSDEDLYRPFNSYVTVSQNESPVMGWIEGTTFEHYAEHLPWMKAIAESGDGKVSKAHLLSLIDTSWNELQAYLNTLTPAQIDGPTDAAGWTVKDHVMHLAVWEDSINALLEGRSRAENSGVPQDVWDSHDFDAINEVIRQQFVALPYDDVQQRFQSVHETLLGKLAAMSDEDLYRPYQHYQPGDQRTDPVVNWVNGDTFEHYAEHLPWIRAIVEGGR